MLSGSGYGFLLKKSVVKANHNTDWFIEHKFYQHQDNHYVKTK